MILLKPWGLRKKSLLNNLMSFRELLCRNYLCLRLGLKETPLYKHPQESEIGKMASLLILAESVAPSRRLPFGLLLRTYSLDVRPVALHEMWEPGGLDQVALVITLEMRSI
jgi:hypothetical protein